MNLTVLGNFHIPRPLREFWRFCTMVENKKKHRQNSHPIIHCPTSEGVSEVSERTSEHMRVAQYLHLCSFQLSTIVQNPRNGLGTWKLPKTVKFISKWSIYNHSISLSLSLSLFLSLNFPGLVFHTVTS